MVVIERYRLTEQIYNALKERIIKGNLKLGEELVLEKISEEYAVSLTPIREAIRKLEGEMLVEEDEKKKLKVINLSYTDIERLYDFRTALELLGIEWGFERISHEKCQRYLMDIEEIFKQNTDTKILSNWEDKHDIDLHWMIISASENRWLKESFLRYKNLIHIVAKIYTNFEKDKKSYKEHIDIVKAILSGDKRLAKIALHNHLKIAKSDLLFFYKNNMEKEIL